MNYSETLAYLYSRLPMYSRIGKAAYRKDLTNTLLLCELLNHPENKFRSIHIAGTNGKGSTSHMLAAILQESGYKTGLHTSPHLKDFRERVRINGEMIPESYVIEFVQKYKESLEKIDCSFFEWTVGLAFDYFEKSKVDIAVIETGLGGRLDSTNVIVPVLSVITNISYDHMDMLGDTLEKIAFEKAGIIKHHIPVVIGESAYSNAHFLQHKSGSASRIEDIFRDVAKEKNASINFADQLYNIKRKDVLKVETTYEQKIKIVVEKNSDLSERIFVLDLPGNYQEKNILTVLASIDELRKLDMIIPDEKIQSALSHVKKLTGLRGRWDILQEKPLIIADVAHNEAGLRYALDQLKDYDFDNLHFVIGFVKEKDLSTILKLFPREGRYYFCKPDIPRGLDASELKKKADENGLKGETYASVQDAFIAAKDAALPEDIIYAGGSTFVVAEII